MKNTPSVNNIYTFKDVSVTVNGKDLPISSGQLRFMENAIPSLTLIIDPVHSMQDPMDVATAPTLGLIAAEHEYFADLAVRRTKCTFKATIMKMEEPEQTVVLKDWILTGAGITSASAGGSVTLELQLQHPVCLCQDSVLVIPFVPYARNLTADATSSFSDIVAAIVGITEIYSQAPMAPSLETVGVTPCGSGGSGAGGSMTVEAAVKFMQQQLKTAAATLKKNMEWDGSTAGGGNWPLQSCLSGQLANIKRSLCDYFVLSTANNLWELFVRKITNDWGCSLTPSFNGPMKLRPFSPWREVDMIVYDEDIAELYFPGIDPSPIVGVTVTDSYATNTKSYYPENGQQEEYSSAGIMFAPPAIVSSPDIYRGTVMQTEIPGWMVSAQNNQAAAEGEKANALSLDADGKLVTPAGIEQGYLPTNTVSAAASTPVANWAGALLTYAQACFYSVFRQGVQVGLSTRLMIHSNHGVADGDIQAYLPGNVCSVQSGDGTVVFDFYATSVIHSFDCAAGTAGTEIAGMYARPEGGFKGIVEPPVVNPLYSGA